MPTDDLDRFCCQNPECDSYGRRGGEDILVIDHFGKTRHRLEKRSQTDRLPAPR
jgi:hypothetical protein